VTTRAQPTRSWESAWRHLFRHIDEPAELRRNPLAAPFFSTADCARGDDEALQAIRSALLAALDEHELELRSAGESQKARRRRHIVEAQILGRQRAAEIAVGLHLSRMQLYRERREVCVRLARALVDTTKRPVVVRANAPAPALARAGALAERCDTERAHALLEDVASNCGEQSDRIAALVQSANLLIEALEAQRAARRLDEAAEVASADAAQLGEREAFARSRIAWARAKLERANGRVSPGWVPDVLAQARAHAPERPGDREQLIDELLEAASFALREGRFVRFRECLGRAQSLFAGLPEPSTRQRARLLLLGALVYEDRHDGAELDDARDARRMLEMAAAVARADGLHLTSIDAALSAAGIASHTLGDPAAAVREATPAVELALRTGNRRLIADACSFAAGLRNANGEFRTSIELASLAMRWGKLDLWQHAFVRAIKAQSHYDLREYRCAGEVAEEAVALATRIDNRRLLGATLRVSALAQQARGEPLARERIGSALDLLERYGCRHSLRAAYQASVTITGDREHARRARALTPRRSARG
jgi:hypothetical protein